MDADLEYTHGTKYFRFLKAITIAFLYNLFLIIESNLHIYFIRFNHKYDFKSGPAILTLMLDFFIELQLQI